MRYARCLDVHSVRKLELYQQCHGAIQGGCQIVSNALVFKALQLLQQQDVLPAIACHDSTVSLEYPPVFC